MKRIQSGLVSVFVLLSASTVFAGGVLSSAPVDVQAAQDSRCSVVNTGSKDVKAVTVAIHFAGGSLATSMDCAPLAPGAVCTAGSTAALAMLRYCKVTVDGSAKALRGTYCNDTTGICETLR